MNEYEPHTIPFTYLNIRMKNNVFTNNVFTKQDLINLSKYSNVEQIH
jgi:hypothetical protein